MTDWFRQTEWTPAIAAAFAARLARARDKGQYLCIQAHTLLATDPAAAAGLCRQALALDDPDWHARAGLYLGTALALSGDGDGAITALDQAMVAEAANPAFRTGAWLDHALLVAAGERGDLYEAVWRRLDERCGDDGLDAPVEALAALALIGHARGEDMRETASAALDALPALHEGAGLAGAIDLAGLAARLGAIAGDQVPRVSP